MDKQIKGKIFNIDIFLEEEFRGSGFAKKAFTLSINELSKMYKEYSILASVKIDNNNSIKFFKNLNFMLKEINEKFFVYERKL